ncbi:MAG: DUF4372 domain-containing protein, partial [Candidatus Moranbacteria bacterium]|nr:DUF4372 domain-containing protein [Candidatus Moranbacteria bacterium]
MSDNNFIPFSNETFFSLMEKYQGMPDAFQNLIDIQVKNLRSINKARQSSIDSVKKIASYQQGMFSQIMQLICQDHFKKCVDRYKGDRYTKSFSCWQQLLVLLFAQAKGLDSLRDIEVRLQSHQNKWYHLGLN